MIPLFHVMITHVLAEEVRQEGVEKTHVNIADNLCSRALQMLFKFMCSDIKETLEFIKSIKHRDRIIHA